MPKLLSSKEIVKILSNAGFIFVSQKGSHAKFRNKTAGAMATVIVPMGQKEVPLGTLRSIIRQSELTKDDFLG